MSKIQFYSAIFVTLVVVTIQSNKALQQKQQSSNFSEYSTTNRDFQLEQESINEDVQSDQPHVPHAKKEKVKGPELCDTSFSSGEGDVLSCKNIQNLNFVLDEVTGSTTTLEISESLLLYLNLTSFHRFPNLTTISVTNSSLISLEGLLPRNILHINLSWNKLNNETIAEAFGGDNQSEFKVEIIDLSHNWDETVVELPRPIFTLPRLKSLYLAGNQLEGQFVWGVLWEWANDSSQILKDADDTFCVFPQHRKEFSLLGCLLAKTDLETTCATVDSSQCSSCGLHGLQKDIEEEYPKYRISHKGKHGSTSISLDLNCSNKSLTKFPKVPLQTWKLDISYNSIQDLSPLESCPYVIYLDATSNFVKIETMLGSPFLSDFMSLSLQSNRIQRLPSKFLQAVRIVQTRQDKRTGDIFLGYNYLTCDCFSATETKSLLNSMKNPDWKEIFCENLQAPNATDNLPFKDLKITDVCHIHKETNPDQQIWIYLIIGVEAILIFLIVIKVWYDRRVFRKTGKLPWCSQHMPKMPCDAILEGKKDRRATNTNNSVMSAHQSQNSVHRSNSNAGSRSNPSSSKNNLRVPNVRFNIHFKTSRSNSDSSQTPSHQSTDIEMESCNKSLLSHC